MSITSSSQRKIARESAKLAAWFGVIMLGVIMLGAACDKGHEHEHEHAHAHEHAHDDAHAHAHPEESAKEDAKADGHGHEHGHEHGHGHGHDEGHAHGDEGPDPIAITKWTKDHELFVELDPPRPFKPVSFHAHVTKLDGFKPATKGRFTVRYLEGKKVAAEVSVDQVLRAGIFAPKGPAPPGGTYELEMIFEDGDERAVFACGTVEVANEHDPQPAGDAAALSFLKEQQWKIPFATAWAEQRAMAREIELPAVIESAGSDQLTLAAPTGGRFFHNDKVALAEGIVLKKGTVIGTIAPTVAGDDFSRLQLAVDEAKLEKQQAEREHKRIKPLVDEGILPKKRLIEVESQIASASARLKNARRRVGQVLAPGGGGGIPIKATRTGTIAQVLAKNGAPVAPGEALVRLLGRGGLWSKARFVAQNADDHAGAKPVALRVGGQRVALGKDAKFLSLTPLVDQTTQLASWTAELGEIAGASEAGVRPGASVVLLVRVGAPKERNAVPESAITEINTHPFVFVQTGGESFLKRRVTLGVRDGGFVEITEGVRPGERVVTRGGFDIHLAVVMGVVESHRH